MLQPFKNFPDALQVLDIAKRQGLESVDRDVLQLLSRGLDAHFTSLIRQVFSMTRQRTDADRLPS